MRHRAPQRSPEGAGPDRCPSPAARAGAPQLLQNPFEPQSAGPWQLPPVAMLNHRSSDLGMPVVSQHISGLVLGLVISMPRSRAPPPVVAPIYDWTGFYIGGNGGG